MNWYLLVLKRYADFNRRSRRKEYWMFVLFNVIFSAVFTVCDYAFGFDSYCFNYGLFSTIYDLAVFLPVLAVSVRRLHDIGESGWKLFIALIPLIGAIWLLVLFVTDGTPGENRYGPNPKGELQVLHK